MSKIRTDETTNNVNMLKRVGVATLLVLAMFGVSLVTGTGAEFAGTLLALITWSYAVKLVGFNRW